MKSIATLLRGLALCFGLALLPGCGSDDAPTAPAPAAPMVEVTWEARQLRVVDDCDASAGKAEGDFHISFKLSEVTGGEEKTLAERTNVIIKANSDTYVLRSQLDIAVKAQVALKDGARLLLRMSIYENDTDGPQVSIGNGYHYTYSAISERWESDDDDGAMDFGSPDTQTLTLRDNAGDACLVYLYGQFSQKVITE
jgi:hypothetical protein